MQPNIIVIDNAVSSENNPHNRIISLMTALTYNLASYNKLKAIARRNGLKKSENYCNNIKYFCNQIVHYE